MTGAGDTVIADPGVALAAGATPAEAAQLANDAAGVVGDPLRRGGRRSATS